MTQSSDPSLLVPLRQRPLLRSGGAPRRPLPPRSRGGGGRPPMRPPTGASSRSMRKRRRSPLAFVSVLIAITAAVLGLIFVLCLPALGEARELQTGGAGTTAETLAPTNVNIYRPDETTNDWAIEYVQTTVFRKYMLDCGSMMEPNEPPIVSLGSVEQSSVDTRGAVGAARSQITALSYDAAVLAFQQAHPPIAEDVASKIDAEAASAWCADALRHQKWMVLAASPIGWVVGGIGLVICLFLGFAFAGGGGGGGGGSMRGSLTPNLFGNGFTLRLWR